MTSVREQIQLLCLWLGFKEAHHPWSKYCVTYSPTHLLTHLASVFIPLQLTNTIPGKPKMEVPTIPRLSSFVTMALDVVYIRNFSGNKVADAFKSAIEDR